ncbi:hypothetical protein [Pseudomonas viridiflava]|uniref:hypothetical protein n=1 Tax=Pseudomonas viridiflava TaxID=33069 RepID=UPI000F011EF4|nr:hypothetical protein [Pseudomonas viridiflava]QXG35047.1 hypothetical protein KTT61_23750 [Pseudomonas viridiflava]QXG43265.1 hypothetical protein KTT55_12520 [Pseudomonas viridiflava]
MKSQSNSLSDNKFSALAAKINQTQSLSVSRSPKEVKSLLTTKEIFKTGMVALMDGEPRYM